MKRLKKDTVLVYVSVPSSLYADLEKLNSAYNKSNDRRPPWIMEPRKINEFLVEIAKDFVSKHAIAAPALKAPAQFTEGSIDELRKL